MSQQAGRWKGRFRGRHQPCLMLIGAVFLVLSSVGAHAQHSPFAPQQSTDSALGLMLAHVPATLSDLDDPEGANLTYANIAAQLQAVGVTPPDSMDDERSKAWIDATRGLPMAMPAAQFLKVWREDYGFDLFQADQTLQISLPPFDLSLYRGRFNNQEVLGALGDIGYQPVDNDGAILSIRGDYEQDVQAQTAYKLAAMNYATILDDGTLAFASALGILEEVLEVQAGERASLAERSDIALLLASAPNDLASAMIVPGSMLVAGIPDQVLDLDPGATPDLAAAATEIAERSGLPPIANVLLGMSVGGPISVDDTATSPVADVPDARAVVIVAMHSPDAAQTAAPIIAERLATQASVVTDEPFAEIFPQRTVEPIPGSPIVVVDLVLGEGTGRDILMRLLFARDLGFLAW